MIKINSLRFYHVSLILVNLVNFIFLLTGCNLNSTNLPYDSNILKQWESEKNIMASIANECRTTKATYSFIGSYHRDIPIDQISMFEGCKLKQKSLLKGNVYKLIHTARDLKKKQVLFITSQHISKEGWWIWEEPILEEKGFMYVSQDKELPINSENQPRDKIDSIKTGLDQFVGNLNLTNEPGKIDSCEVWMFRPIAPKWYLFYRQNRGCQFRGL
jgi:hypothetical protein